MYFSVITATSVGYGDIVPVGIAKLLASIQSILTIFISAIFVTKPSATVGNRAVSGAIS